MSEGILATNFIEPYFVKEVGQIGLMSKDIAQALGVPLKKINEKIRREKWTNIKQWHPAPYGAHYFFSTQAAKAFVARYSNEVGDAYLKFLFDCEEVALNKVPKLLSVIEQLKKFVETKKVDTKKGLVVTKKIIITRGLFEPLVEIIKEKCKLDDLSIAERSQWIFEHRSSIAEGLLKKNNDDMRMAKIIPISTITKKQLEKKEI